MNGRLAPVVALDDVGQEYTVSVRPSAVAVIGEGFLYHTRIARMILIGGLKSGPSLVVADSPENLDVLHADEEFVLVDGPRTMHFYVRPELVVLVGTATITRTGDRVLPLHFRGLDVAIDVLDTFPNRIKLRLPSAPMPEIALGRD